MAAGTMVAMRVQRQLNDPDTYRKCSSAWGRNSLIPCLRPSLLLGGFNGPSTLAERLR
jgi:hypothetical protein